MLVSLRGGPKRSWHQEERRRKGQKNDDFDASSVSCVGTKKLFTNKRQAGSKSLFCGNDSGEQKRKTNSLKVVSHISPRYFSTKVSNLCPRRVQLGNRLRFQSPLCHYALWVFPSPLWGEICQTIPLPSCGRLLISQSRKFRNKREKTAHFRTQKRRVARRPHPFFLSLNPHPQGE